MSKSRRKSRTWVFVLLIALVLVTLVMGVIVGAVHIPLSETLAYLVGRGDPASSHYLIVSQIRFPRVLLGLLVGCGLALSGGAMQGLFRNPLASPYILGIASGASTGAAIVILLNTRGVFFLPLGAFIGGGLVVGIVYRLAQSGRKGTSVYTLILAGVAVGALFSAVTSFLIYLSSGSDRTTDVIFWIMGGLSRANWPSVWVLAPIVLFSSVVILTLSRDLNALAMGEEGAFHLGVDPEKSKRLLLVVSTLLTSSSVAFAGTIGFVGLIIPHIMRLIVGPDHRVLLPAIGMAGSVFLVWADMAARSVLSPAELPVGIITAFLGAPFFLYLLRTRRAQM